ncbi:hypothetical protein [Candidatus Pelagibacter sp. HIMB1715]|uniref:hypothetical protein n=1 Tax=Candidatus Pelagibacter sp. HIMB1715 TaxID=3413369 RepID=UPI003F850C75
MKLENFDNYFKLYLITIFLFANYFLIQKYNNPVEWTISEWLINYQGGFTRRGLIGELVYQLHKIFPFTLREIILGLQILTYFIYYILVYFYLRKINKNYLLIFAIFSPLFIIYPIAEVEVLARKEIFVFIAFVLISNLFSGQKINNLKYICFSIILATTTLIWEGVIIYLSFFILILVVKNNFLLSKIFLFKLFLSILPVLIIFYFMFYFKLTPQELKMMCGKIGECYGAMTYLNNDLASNISEVKSKIKFEFIIRYILIFLIGFLPLLLLINKSEFFFKKKKYYNKRFFLVLSLTFLPTLFFFYIAQDWGRWINISYTLLLLTYVFCIKNKLIKFNKYNLNLKYLYNKKIVILLLIIFSFGWSPKTLINEDVGSIPIYRKAAIIFKNSLN